MQSQQNNHNMDNSVLMDTEKYQRILKLKLNEDSKNNVITSINALSNRTDLHIVSPNYIYSPASSSDTEFVKDGEMWGLNGTNGINVEKAWNFSIGYSSLQVGIIDTGIQGEHPDLWANLTATLNVDCTSSTASFEPFEELIDYNGHGTHVAGTIGAIGNNDLDILGVCPNVELISLRIYNEVGYGTTENLACAIDYATVNNIPILNFSSQQREYDANIAIKLANYQRLLICIAGNGGNDHIGDNNDIISVYPGDFSYNQTFSDRVISVGALNSDGTKRLSSNYGQNSVSIYAPGSNILSTFPEHICESICSKEDSQLGDYQLAIKAGHYEDGYHYAGGTSMAAPHVTGVAALLLSQNYSLTASQLKAAIINGSDTITLQMNDGSTQTVKKLNAAKAMKYALDHYGNSTTLLYNDKEFSKELYDGMNYTLMMNVQNEYNYGFTISSTSALNVSLFDSELNEVSISKTISNNGCQFNFNENLELGKYYLKVNFVDPIYHGTVHITIDGEPCTHSYNYQYETFNLTYHRAICICGAHILQPHIARVSDTTQISRCLICKGVVGNTSLNPINSLQVQYVTANGSFIAPNGVIYLVDEDIVAYFNGTLIFFKKEESLIVL